MAVPKEILNIKDFSLSLAGKIIFQNLNLSLNSQECLLITGVSGVGKTSLLRSINRLNEEISTCSHSGEISLFSQNHWYNIYDPSINVTWLRRKIGMLLQSPQVLPFSIEKNFVLPMKWILQLNKNNSLEKMEAHLRLVGLWDEVKDELNKPAEQLSLGQQQRLALAQLLCLEPEILLLDEPTASLDAKSALCIFECLNKIKQKLSIVIVSHHPDELVGITDRSFELGA